MRGIRIGAFSVAGLLVCLLIYRVLTVDPPRPKNNTILDEASGSQPNVPPPPDLPESKTAQPSKMRTGGGKIVKAPAPARVAEVVPQQPQPSGAKPVIWRGNDPADYADDGPATPAPAEVASGDEPKGPVIVRPPERSKEDSRGVRWVKAVGHALGIGKPKDPAEEAFR